MTMFRAHVKLRINSVLSPVWIDFPAANYTLAKAQLYALYGKENVLSVIKKSGG